MVGDVIGTRTVRNAATGQRIDIPLAGEHLPPGPRTIELSTSEPLVIATTDGEPDLWRIAPVVDDGLRLVATGAVTLYERPDAAAAWFVPGLLPDEVNLDLHGLALPTASRSNFSYHCGRARRPRGRHR